MMVMMSQYHSFLLRLWLADGAEHPLWHASLENPHTREVHGFDSLEKLFEYLLALTRAGERRRPAEADGIELPLRNGEGLLSEKSEG
jgi:hypothetical protein